MEENPFVFAKAVGGDFFTESWKSRDNIFDCKVQKTMGLQV